MIEARLADKREVEAWNAERLIDRKVRVVGQLGIDRREDGIRHRMLQPLDDVTYECSVTRARFEHETWARYSASLEVDDGPHVPYSRRACKHPRAEETR